MDGDIMVWGHVTGRFFLSLVGLAARANYSSERELRLNWKLAFWFFEEFSSQCKNL